MNIFDKPYYLLHYFSNEIHVKCPSCSGLATITSNNELNCSERDKSARLSCLKCGYITGSKKKWEGFYIGYIGKDYNGQNCGHCGSKFYFETKPTKKTYETEIIRCESCQKEKEYTLDWFRYHLGTPTDPFMGLALYYIKEVKGNLLWVYNVEHVLYLIDYLSANIRKREMVGQYTMIATLPNFITSAKNKNTIIKQLRKFEADIRENKA
jgi:hypothetical protein